MRNPPPNQEPTAPLPLVLYRAMVTPVAEACDPRSTLVEYFVFFEAPRLRHTATLAAMLHHAWQVDVSTLLITCSSERELLDDFSMGPAEDGDVRLFENGYDTQHIFYCDPARTQFLVRPGTQERLQAGLAVANRRRLEGFARRAFDVARRAGLADWVRAESVAATSAGARQ